MVRRKKIRISKGESCCRDDLVRLGMTNITGQYRISLLPRYRFDYHFTYGDNEYLLEFDGQQHFEFTPWFHRTEKIFRKQQRRDLLKSAVALMSGYVVIRIAYSDIGRIQDIVKTAIEGKKRLYLSNLDMYEYLRLPKIPIDWLRKYNFKILSQIS